MELTMKIHIELINAFGDKYIKLHGDCLNHYRELIALCGHELLMKKGLSHNAKRALRLLFGPSYIDDIRAYYGDDVHFISAIHPIPEWNEPNVQTLMSDLCKGFRLNE